LFREVSRHPGEFQDDARAALALSGNDEGAAPVHVTGFAEAFSAGKSALMQMDSSQLAVKLAANNNPEGVPDLEEQVTSSRQQALSYFEQAIKFIDDKAPQEDAAAARYYLCWLYWEGGRTEEAAELGQQLAEDSPDSQYAPTAAKVTLAAYERLYLEAKNADAANADLLAEKLRNIAELIVERWNDSEAATTATNLLISLALRDNQFEEADRLLAQLPEKSRGAAGLSLGGTLWSQYLQQTIGSDLPPTAATLELKTRAAKLLAAGYAALAKSSDITPAQAAGVLYYVQVLLADGDATQAVEVLENPSIGPLAVMKRGGDDEQDQAFALETNKAALRAYVSVDPPRNDEAIAMMEQLEEITGDSATARNQLTGIYVNLGLQLQEQIKKLTASGDEVKARGVADAFANLLERVAERSDSQSWPVQNWLAQTSLQLGSGLSGADADRYLGQAEDAYRSILAEVEKDPKFAPSEVAVLAVRKKLGETLQTRGNYALAVEQFEAILKEKPNMLELQQATATALQAWGSAKRDVKVLEQSIRGMKPQANGKNLVWGWLQLATVADYAKRKAEQSGDDSPQNKEAAAKYLDVYFLARYQAAQARLAAAKLATGASRAKQIATVRQSIAALKQLYPDLGGTHWQAKFDALLKETDALMKEAGE
jgi:tetratricopeptide (TPR) repeat protein